MENERLCRRELRGSLRNKFRDSTKGADRQQKRRFRRLTSGRSMVRQKALVDANERTLEERTTDAAPSRACQKITSLPFQVIEPCRAARVLACQQTIPRAIFTNLRRGSAVVHPSEFSSSRVRRRRFTTRVQLDHPESDSRLWTHRKSCPLYHFPGLRF